MAATNPSSSPDRSDEPSGRPVLVSTSAPTSRRSRWFWLFICILAVAAIGVIGYMLLYSGGGGYGGSGGGGGSGGAGGYFILALSADQARRIVDRFRPGR